MNPTKDIRLLTLAGLVLLALVLLIYPMVLKKSGVVVSSISEDSPCQEIITEGSIITELAGVPIQNSNSFYKAVKGLEGTVTFIINGNPRSCEIPSDSEFNVVVKDIKRKALKFGVDTQGGTEIVLKPEKDVSDETIQEMLGILKFRAKNHRLTNSQFQIENNSIHVLFDPDDEIEIKKIIKQGIIETRFIQSIQTTNKTGELIVNNKRYNVIPEDESVLVNDSEYKINDIFTLEGLDIKVYNITENATIFSINVFDDQDIIKTLGGESNRILQQEGGYVFVFQAELSEKASENFAKATEGQEVMISPSGESYLKDPLVVFLDGEPVITMPIPQSDVGKEIKTMPIWGFERTRDEASYKMLRLTTVLESGRLPVKLNTEKISDVDSPKKGLINNIIRGTLIGLLIVFTVAFIRYRNIKKIAFMALILMTEIILILGSAFSQGFVVIVLVSGILLSIIKKEVRGWERWLSLVLMFIISFGIVVNKWTLDLPSVFGISVMLCVNLLQSFIVNENLIKDLSVIKKHENILRIIWRIALVVCILMAPVFFMSGLKGLAIATIIGVMISTTMTKPIYTDLSERMK